MSERNDILKQLYTDLNTITSIKEVRRGIHMAEDMNIKPAISFWCFKDEVEKHMLNNQIQRAIRIQMFLYASTKGIGDVDNIHDLVDTVEFFLYDNTQWTYADNTRIDDLIIYEGGSQDAVSIAVLEFRIRYIQSL